MFLAEDATVRLGVGKNMVAAIRFWTTAFRVLDRVPSPENSRVAHSRPTPLGIALLDENIGYDPYLESLATMWILHWHLVSAVSNVPVWWSTFNSFTALEFSEQQLEAFVSDEVLATAWTPPSPSTIGKDIACLIHMYAPRTARARQGIDDVLDSPFRQLGLISAAAGSSGHYRFNRRSKPGLSAEIVVYICLDYLARNEPDAKTATLTHLANDPGTPGRLLKLTEETMHQAFRTVADRYEEVSVSMPAGALQLAFKGDPAEIASMLLHANYSRRQKSMSVGALVAGTAARECGDAEVCTQEDGTLFSAASVAKKISGIRQVRKTSALQKSRAKAKAK